jgi:Flp pilus assembly protein TadD
LDRKILQILALLVFGASCAHRQADLRKPSAQDNFGVQMARMNLWREALFRFQRAVDIDPADAMARNNLAVAWEANGDFDKARKEYLEALKLDRSNQYIQKNYSRFVEFLSRNRKRQQKDLKTASAPAAPQPTEVSPPPPPQASPPPTPVPPPPPPGEPR